MVKFFIESKKYCPKCKRWTTHIEYGGDTKCEVCKNVLVGEERPDTFSLDEIKKSIELETLSMEMFEKHFANCSIKEQTLIKEEFTRRERNKYGW